MAIIDLGLYPELANACFDLISKRFPKGESLSRPASLSQEFPLLLSVHNRSRNLISVSDKKEVEATVSYRIFDMKSPEHGEKKLRVAALGLVCTAEAHQGQGLATALIEEAEKRALKEGATLMWLWSDQKDFYEKRDYLLCGTNFEWNLKTEKFSAEQTTLISPLNDLSEIFPFWHSRAQGPQRDLEDYEKFLATPDTYFFLAPDKKSFAVMGKGRELRKYIHDCGGESDSLLSLITQLGLQWEAEKLHLPRSFQNFSSFQKAFGEPEKQAMGYAKILNPPRLIDWIEASKDFPEQADLQIDPKLWSIFKKGHKEALFESSDAGHLLQLFLGPWNFSELSGLSPELSELFKGFPPRDLYFWGLDAV